MKKMEVGILILGIVLSFTHSGQAQQIDTHCCCNVLCYYSYYQFDGVRVNRHGFTMSFDECELVSDLGIFSAKDRCEAPFYLVTFCKNRKDQAEAELEKTAIGDFYSFWYSKSEGSCMAEEVECPIEDTLGAEDERLYILRKFRDEVLSPTLVGQEIIKLYYEWSPSIVKLMEEDEEFEQEFKDMIDEVLPMVKEAVQ